MEIDKLKFEDSDTFKKYKKEIINNKDRYKSVLLDIFEKNGYIDSDISKEIIDIWEEEWKEEANIYIDKLKFSYYAFEEYREKIIKDKERYKPVLLDIFEKDEYIYSRIRRKIIDIWEKEWKNLPNIYIDRLKFYCDPWLNVFKEYKEEICRNKERYKPVLLQLLEDDKIDSDIKKEIVDIWEKSWKEEGEIEGKIEVIDIDNIEYFIENKDEIIKDREKYEATVRRCFNIETYKEIKPILNSWGDSDIELLTKLLLKTTYETYNTLYSELKDELIENRDSIIENISKNYKTKLKDKVVKLFIITIVQTTDELEDILELLKIKDMDKLVNNIIELDLDNKIDSKVLENIVKIVTVKISELEYIKLLIEIKKDKDNLSENCIEILKNILNKIETKENLENLTKELGFDNSIEMLKYLRDERVPIETTSCIEVLREIFDKIDSKDSFDKFVEEFEFKSSIEFLEYLKDKKVPLEFSKRYMKLLEEYYPTEFNEFKKNLEERLVDDFKGTSYENCVEYSKYSDILDNIYNYEDIMKFRVVIENGRYLNKKKISKVDIEYSKKEKIKIAYWGKYKNVKKLSNLEWYLNSILPIEDKYINYEIDDLGFNDKKERYFKYNDNNIVVKLKDRKLKIFNSSGTEVKRLSSTSEDFYTVRTLENIKELKAMIKNVYTDGDNGIKKEYCNDVLRDYDLWREIYIDNILLQEYSTNLIWEEVDNDDNIVGRFRYTQDGEFCDSNDDEYNINKENRIRLLSLDKVSNDEIERWKEQLDDYEIVQPVPQLELYNLDYSDIDPDNLDISNNEIELGKLEKNDIGLELKFKDDEMYFEIENILKIQLEDKIKWTKYKTLSKDTIVKISRINLLNNSDYSLRMVKLVKNKLGI